jgi:hypothetical protein
MCSPAKGLILVRNYANGRPALFAPKAQFVAGQPQDTFDEIELPSGEPDGRDAQAEQVFVARDQAGLIGGALLDRKMLRQVGKIGLGFRLDGLEDPDRPILIEAATEEKHRI